MVAVGPLITSSTVPRCVAAVIPAGIKFFLSCYQKKINNNPKKKNESGEVGKKIAKICQVDAAAENSPHDSAKADGGMEGRSDVSCWGCDMNVL